MRKKSQSPTKRVVVSTVGINTYSHFRSLRNAINDTEAVRSVFGKMFHTKHVEPINDERVTRKRIDQLILDELPEVLKEDDTFVFFFAGHGISQSTDVVGSKNESGYLVPGHAELNKFGQYIPIQPLLQNIGKLPCRHVLVILDSCHSGFALGDEIETFNSDNTKTGKRWQQRRSRYVITSAGPGQEAMDSGPVKNLSLFVGTLLKGLENEEADYNKDGFLDMWELGRYLQSEVEKYSKGRQRPDFGRFYFDDRGDMHLPLKLWSPGKETTTWPDSEKYLVKTPGTVTQRRMRNMLTFSSIVVLVLLLALFANKISGSNHSPDEIVLAILPFEESSESSSMPLKPEYFSAALSEKLSFIPELIVINQNDFLKSRNVMARAQMISPLILDEALDSIQATHFIKGTIYGEPDRGKTPFVNVELTRVGKTKPEWSDKFEISDNPRVYETIAFEIAQKLNLTIDQRAASRLEKKRDPEVVKLYTHAYGLWLNRDDTTSYFSSIKLLEQALKIDSLDDQLHGFLALNLIVGHQRSYFGEVILRRVRDHAEAALLLNPLEPYALIAMGAISETIDKNFKDAKQYYQKAFEISPRDGMTLQALAELSLYTGEFKNALDYIETANLVSPANETILRYLSWCLMANGYVNASYNKDEESIRIFTDQVNTNYYKWASSLIQHDYDSAIAHIPAGHGLTDLMKGLVYIEQNDSLKYTELITSDDVHPAIEKNLGLIWLIHQNENDSAKILFSTMMQNDEFALNWFVQTYPFNCFNKFRSDIGMQEIALIHGIQLSPHPYFEYELGKEE